MKSSFETGSLYSSSTISTYSLGALPLTLSYEVFSSSVNWNILRPVAAATSSYSDSMGTRFDFLGDSLIKPLSVSILIRLRFFRCFTALTLELLRNLFLHLKACSFRCRVM